LQARKFIIMKKIFISTILLSLLCFAGIKIFACTNILVSKGASADGSVMITYNADAGGFMEPLYWMEAQDWGDNDSLEVYEWDTGKFLGKIKQVKHTYKVIGNMNENQVALGETTFGGREELYETPNGIIDYGSMMYIALQRAKTAREAIKIMTDLVAEYGYASEGESISVSDPNEAWIFEIIGKGTKEKGAVWVARKVPDGYICAHANQARIREVPLKDKDCLYAPDLFTFAEKMGYWNSKSDTVFSFVDAYCPLAPEGLFLCEGRVWIIFRRAAPSQNFTSDYWRGVKTAEPYPLFIKPDKKLSVKDVMALMRDHFEGTDFDMTKGFMAGPFSCPYRWKSLYFQAPNDTITAYGWERPVSTQQTAFSFVAQSRSEVENYMGVFWYAVDDTYSDCYMPLYVCMKERPAPFATADVTKYDWNSASWVFNLVANYAYSKYSYIIKDIQAVQSELENNFHDQQPVVEETAKELYKKDKELAINYLSDYSYTNALLVVEHWKELYAYIVTKYNDGYINDGSDNGRHPKGVGYGSEWIQRVLKEQPEYYKIEWENPVKK
jgi:dipeptidase